MASGAPISLVISFINYLSYIKGLWVFFSVKLVKCSSRSHRYLHNRAVKCVYMFVSLSAFTSVVLLIDRQGAWSDDAMRQQQPMWCALLLSCRPALIPASRPTFVWLLLCLWSPTAPGLCVWCVCVFACVLLPWQIYSSPGLHPSIGYNREGEGGGRKAFWKTLLLPISPATFRPMIHSPVDIFLQTNWMN